MSSKGTTLSRLAAGISVDVGILTTLTPTFAMRLYQVPEEQATGAARFGLRLFGVRNVMIGGAALAGNEQAKTAVLAMQVPDQLIMWHALLAGYIPRKTALLALMTSTAVLSLAAVGYLAEQGESEAESGGEWGPGQWESEPDSATGAEERQAG